MIIPNLLVTDDDTAFRSVLCEALVRRGLRVTEAGDGEEAIEVLRRTRVHMAIVDVHMPRATGLEVIKHLLEFAERPPCVLMSAAMDDEIRREAERMQVYRVLSKPIRLNVLRDVVNAALTEAYGWKPDVA